jgi:BirA family biotin operon repressor/biotin-[acetyl-CoA-carboxylase] ligase
MEQNWFNDLPVKIIGKNIICYKKVTSTNDLAWLEASKNVSEGTVILAGEQLKGRGRFGRTWFSPVDKGIWASVVLRPKITVEESYYLMVIGAIAICELLKEEFGLNPLIRWPNDVFVDGRKIAGILVESKYSLNNPEAAVLGIGINIEISKGSIPADLKDIITSLSGETGKEVDLKDITRKFLIKLDEWYQKIIAKEFNQITESWRIMSGVLGKKVRVEINGVFIEGRVKNLDLKGGILLELPEGEKRFKPEEITSLRLKE